MHAYAALKNTKNRRICEIAFAFFLFINTNLEMSKLISYVIDSVALWGTVPLWKWYQIVTRVLCRATHFFFFNTCEGF